MTDLEEAKRLLGEVSSDIGLDAYQHVFIISNEARLKIGTVQTLLENVVKREASNCDKCGRLKGIFVSLALASEKLKHVHGSDNVDTATDYIVAAIHMTNSDNPAPCPLLDTLRSEENAPQRPEPWAQKGCKCVGCLRERELFTYIKHIEAENTLREAEIEIYDKPLEGAKVEITRLKAETVQHLAKRVAELEACPYMRDLRRMGWKPPPVPSPPKPAAVSPTQGDEANEVPDEGASTPKARPGADGGDGAPSGSERGQAGEGEQMSDPALRPEWLWAEMKPNTQRSLDANDITDIRTYIERLERLTKYQGDTLIWYKGEHERLEAENEYWKKRADYLADARLKAGIEIARLKAEEAERWPPISEMVLIPPTEKPEKCPDCNGAGFIPDRVGNGRPCPRCNPSLVPDPLPTEEPEKCIYTGAVGPCINPLCGGRVPACAGYKPPEEKVKE